MAGNARGANAGPVDRKADYAVFDALPRSIKEMVWNFAYPLDAGAVSRKAASMGALSGSISAEMFFEDFNREQLARFRDGQITAYWPEGHPMLGEPLKEDWT